MLVTAPMPIHVLLGIIVQLWSTGLRSQYVDLSGGNVNSEGGKKSVFI